MARYRKELSSSFSWPKIGKAKLIANPSRAPTKRLFIIVPKYPVLRCFFQSASRAGFSAKKYLSQIFGRERPWRDRTAGRTYPGGPKFFESCAALAAIGQAKQNVTMARRAELAPTGEVMGIPTNAGASYLAGRDRDDKVAQLVEDRRAQATCWAIREFLFTATPSS
jgi:hypothetical protein